MRDFHSLDAAQKWLDQNRDDITVNIRAYRELYGASPARCMIDCFADSRHPVRLRMAARRLSAALASKHPQFYEPKRARAA